MKKGILIMIAMFMMVSTTEAKNNSNQPNTFTINYYDYNDAVNFVERGIEFYVFTNGDFDFNTQSDYYNDYGFGNHGVRINRDYKGRIRSVGNVFINYDRRGNVTRIGSVFIKYYRGELVRVGNLRVQYDRRGYPIFNGNVRNYYYNNGVQIHVNFGDVYSYNDAYFYRNDFGRNYKRFREDHNYYYYRAQPNAKIGKRSTILKRRKPANVKRNTTRNNNTIKNNSGRRTNTNSYRKAAILKDGKRSTTATTINNNRRTVNTTRNNVTRNTEVKNQSNIKRDSRNANSIVRKNNATRNTEVKNRSNTKRNTRNSNSVVRKNSTVKIKARSADTNKRKNIKRESSKNERTERRRN